MTTLSPLLDLDDADGLVAADVDGALRSAALAGAQVRATATTFAESVGNRLHDLRPRSVVFVAGDGRAGRAASLLIASVSARIGVPLVRTPGTPSWVGPLDVVVVSGDDAGDPRLSESVAAAVRRGAETIVVTPDEGPLRSAAGGRALFVEPRIAVREHNSLMRYLAAGVCVLASISEGNYRPLLPDLALLADSLDDEAARDHPVHEVFHNPAKSVATRMAGRRVVFSGAGAVATELARHGSEVMLRAAGVVTATGELADVIAAEVEASRSSRAQLPAADYDPFFHDEQVDGPRPEAPIRVLVAAPNALSQETQRRTAALADADVLVVSALEPTSVVGDVQTSRPNGFGDIEAMALLATRLEMAAAYLRLIGGG
ncbi:MAG: tobH protein [Rhodococcus sp. (in: high G+C Gram-positive bacteria)]